MIQRFTLELFNLKLLAFRDDHCHLFGGPDLDDRRGLFGQIEIEFLQGLGALGKTAADRRLGQLITFNKTCGAQGRSRLCSDTYQLQKT